MPATGCETVRPLPRSIPHAIDHSTVEGRVEGFEDGHMLSEESKHGHARHAAVLRLVPPAGPKDIRPFPRGGAASGMDESLTILDCHTLARALCSPSRPPLGSEARDAESSRSALVAEPSCSSTLGEVDGTPGTASSSVLPISGLRSEVRLLTLSVPVLGITSSALATTPLSSDQHAAAPHTRKSLPLCPCHLPWLCIAYAAPCSRSRANPVVL
jgi:hypothetical protein